MYLSRLIPNLRHRQVRTDLARPYEMHRTLLRAFPDNVTPGTERLLFRVEAGERMPLPVILAQSRQLPAWDNLPAGYLVTDLSEANPAVKPFALRLDVGQMLSFRLVANPTKRLSTGQADTTGKRIGLYRQEEQLAWLARKGEQHGFGVLTATASRQELSEDRGHALTLFVVQFDGLLAITDGDALAAAVANGIGSAKAFGCGLLSLAPARL